MKNYFNQLSKPKIIGLILIIIISSVRVLRSTEDINQPEDAELKAITKESHIESCVEAGGRAEICSCTFDGLIDELGFSGYLNGIETAYENNESDQDEIDKYAEAITKVFLRCRSEYEKYI